MTSTIDHIVKSTIHVGPNFISLESVKNITCVDDFLFSKGKLMLVFYIILESSTRKSLGGNVSIILDVCLSCLLSEDVLCRCVKTLKH
jgi:hypothetical protein